MKDMFKGVFKALFLIYIVIPICILMCIGVIILFLVLDINIFDFCLKIFKFGINVLFIYFICSICWTFLKFIKKLWKNIKF